MLMLPSLEKHWPLISIALLALLLASLWLWPEQQGVLSLAIIILSVGMLLAFTVHRSMRGEPLRVLRTVLLILSLLIGAGLACRAGGSLASDLATPTSVSTKSPVPTSTAT
jgi:hypothetical protein